jgi:hypothetical protein
MDFTKICRLCSIEKVCSLDKSKSEFHQIPKSNNYRNICKICRNLDQKTRDRNRSKISKITGGSVCISLDSMIDDLTRNIHKNHQNMNVETIRNYTNQLLELANQREIESRVSSDHTLLFSKKDLGLNFENPTHISKIKEALAQEYSDIDIINPTDVYVFDRQDHIKILVDGGCSFDIDQQLYAKNLIISALKTNTSNPQPIDRSALFADIRAITIGFTYFILSPTQYDHGNHKVKIGYTHNLKQRITEGQTFNAEDLTVYACIESRHYKNIETYLHKACVHRHVRGEWFNLTLEEIDTIVRDFTRLEGIWNKFLQFRTTPSLVDPLFLSMEEEIALLKRELAKVKSSKM